jgi:hypothetical protein
MSLEVRLAARKSKGGVAMFTVVLAVLLFIHGLITTMTGMPALADGGRRAWADEGLANAPWLSWWPTNFGRSWLVDAAQLEASGYALGGVVWFVSGLAFAGAALGLFGVPGYGPSGNRSRLRVAVSGYWQQPCSSTPGMRLRCSSI